MSTVVRAPLQTPALPAERFAVARTARGFDAALLVDLANDAAGGHPGQRATIVRDVGGTYTLFYDPRSSARLIELAVTASWRGTYSPGDSVTADLSIVDTLGNSIASSNAAIPFGLKADEAIDPSLAASRLAALHRRVWHLDLDALAATALDPTEIWALRLVLTCDATVYVEAVELSEVSRFAVDALDDPTPYQAPRGAITSSLARLTTALETAHDLNRRTYHHVAVREAAPLLVTSATWAAIPGAIESESAGVPTPWVIAPRPGLTTAGLEYAFRYKTSGAADGYVRFTTSAGATAAVLPGTSGVWADLTDTVGGVPAGPTTTLTWEAKVDAGTLSLATLWLADAPVP